MRKRIFYFFAFFSMFAHANAATRDAQLTNTTGYNYNYMYPYMNNQMRTDLNPGITPSQNSNLIDTVVKTTPLSTSRRVVPRATKTARATTNTTTTARVGTTSATSAQPSRRVVARRGNLRGNETYPYKIKRKLFEETGGKVILSLSQYKYSDEDAALAVEEYETRWQ